jgi:hypothetical protein
MSRLPPTSRVTWDKTYRIIPSRYPPIDLFERIAEPSDWELLAEIEGMTNDRLREEAGDLTRIPRSRCIAGPNSSAIMAAFTHPSPKPGRFDTTTFGAYYAAHSVETAIRETAHHQGVFRRRTREPPCEITMRTYIGRIDAELHDVRGGWPEVHHPEDYAASQALATALRNANGNGIVYESVRHEGGACFAAFFPDVLSRYQPDSWTIQGPHFCYYFDGNAVTSYRRLSIGPLVML